MADVEFFIKDSLGVFVSMDVSDFEYRLNRTVFAVRSDKLKSLGGTTSTQIKLSRTKKNNRVFKGKTDFKSIGKFNFARDFEAIITSGGAELAKGVFRLESIGSTYSGTFYDNGIDWLNSLSDVKINRLGYFDENPTWLAPFDGAKTFNEVNDLSNRETDVIFPTICYNNTSKEDYIDLSDSQIWGGLREFPKDFKAEAGFFGLRMGLRYSDFPPAVYYRNLIERIFKEIGMNIQCSLFGDAAFNARYLPYVGSEYSYNWRNLATVSSLTPYTYQVGETGLDGIYNSVDYDDLKVNIAALPALTNAPRRFWIKDESFRFQIANIIKNDDLGSLVDKITLTNGFDNQGQYTCPADGIYKVRVSSQFKKTYKNFINFFAGANNTNPIWLGSSLLNAFGTHDSSYNPNSPNDCHFGKDDNVLVVLRKSEGGKTSPDTIRNLLQWMNGQSKDFTTKESDVIAYFSPKRFAINQLNPIPEIEYKGSPISNFSEEVKVGDNNGTPYASHDLFVNSGGNQEVNSKADITVNVTLSKGEIIEIFWISLANVRGEVAFSPNHPKPYSDAVQKTTVEQYFGNNAFEPEPVAFDSQYSIEYTEGEYDLDIAKNLPDKTGREIIESFIKQYNLHFKVVKNTIYFVPFVRYYGRQYFDITPRVHFPKFDAWECSPIGAAREWLVGYNNDEKDRLLSLENGGFDQYANVRFLNRNTYSESVADDRNLFSATKFIFSRCVLHNFNQPLALSFPFSIDPVTGELLKKGLESSATFELSEYYVPSIQSKESYNQDTKDKLLKDFDYSPRMLYHLGTVNSYYNISNAYQCLCDFPKAEEIYLYQQKHWFRPTVSQFDGENKQRTGVNYQTLRYDGEEGLFNVYFENLIEFYNKSDILTLNVSLRPSDWNNLEGSKRVVFLDQVFRLMEIRDYDPVTNQPCIIKLMREL